LSSSSPVGCVHARAWARVARLRSAGTVGRVGADVVGVRAGSEQISGTWSVGNVFVEKYSTFTTVQSLMYGDQHNGRQLLDLSLYRGVSTQLLCLYGVPCMPRVF
jgi:hypothetical protein